MKPEMITRAYEQLSAAPRSPAQGLADQSIVVSDEDGFRLVLTRIGELVEFDVEISKPQLKISGDDNTETVTERCRDAALRSIRHLEFFVDLADYGFSLSMEESEFLWIASLVLTGTPSSSLLLLFQNPH
jgi:hypothetical protein